MDMDRYQEYAGETDEYLERCNHDETVALLCLAAGLASEAGEAAGKIRKLFRDAQGMDIDGSRGEAIAAELGDTMWYVARTAAALGYSLEDIAIANLDKLRDRAQRDAISGEGDAR